MAPNYFFKNAFFQIDGVDIIVDCTGSPRAFERGVKWLRRGGVMAVFGCCPPGEEAAVCPEEFFSKELTIFGIKNDPFSYARSIHLAAGMGKRSVYRFIFFFEQSIIFIRFFKETWCLLNFSGKQQWYSWSKTRVISGFPFQVPVQREAWRGNLQAERL